MLAILSPAKDMNVIPDKGYPELSFSIPEFISTSEKMVNQLKGLPTEELAKLMEISSKLAIQNFNRFQNWAIEHTTVNSFPAILFFSGEAYRGLNASRFSKDELQYSQQVLRILSGLYGILKPLDLIMEYRLEIGNMRFNTEERDLYTLWRPLITEALDKAVLQSPGDKYLVNLASLEYSKSIDFQKLNCQVITPQFYEERGGKRKIVTVYAKRARGLMVRFIIKNNIEMITDLKAFDDEGYFYDSKNSTEDVLYFIR